MTAPGATAQQQDARGYMFQIAADDTATTWLEIEAITEFKVDRSEGEEEVETTTFQDAGQYKSEKLQRGATCELTSRMKSVPNTGVVVTGRARVEACDRLLGYAGLVQFRFRHVWDANWEVWTCWVGLGEVGGETNDKTEWECTMHRWGPETFVAKT